MNDPKFNNATLQNDYQKYTPGTELSIDHSNNPLGKYELNVISGDDLLETYYYDDIDECYEDGATLSDQINN